MYYPGLEGVCVGETNISTLDHGGLYRGYSIVELAEKTSFLEVAYLLLRGELPTQDGFADFGAILFDEAVLPESVSSVLCDLPFHAPLLDVVWTGTSLLSHYDPQLSDLDAESNISKAIRLLARIPLLIASRYRNQQGWEPSDYHQEYSFAGNIIFLLTNCEPTTLNERVLDAILVIQSGREFQSADFTARVVASTDADIYSAITAAVSAAHVSNAFLLHEEISQELCPKTELSLEEEWLRALIRGKKIIPGFKKQSSETTGGAAAIQLLKSLCDRLAVDTGKLDGEERAEFIERIVLEEKGLVPDIDWIVGRLYQMTGFSPEVFSAISLIGRIVGWSAHVIEQQEEHRTYSPHARYRGALTREFTPLTNRG